MISLKIDISPIFATSAPEILSKYNIDLSEISLFFDTTETLNINVQSIAQNIKIYLLEWYTELRKATSIEINQDLKKIFDILNNSVLSLQKVGDPNESNYRLNYTNKLVIQSAELNVVPETPLFIVTDLPLNELSDEALVDWIEESAEKTRNGISVLQQRVGQNLDKMVELADDIKEGAEQARQQSEYPVHLLDLQNVIEETKAKTGQLQILAEALQKFVAYS